jgi:signal transduction histidine kinase
MPLDRTLIEDLVDRAAERIQKEGKRAFPELRDKTGPFVFMDTYIFVQDLTGVELVNPAQPSLEGRNLRDLKDAQGTKVVREQIALAKKKDRAWMDVYWYRPGTNEPAPKHTYLRRVTSAGKTYIVGSGLYSTEPTNRPTQNSPAPGGS